MILGGGREITNTAITLRLPDLPPSVDLAALGTSCGVTPDDLGALSMGLRWRSREEASREAIAKVGRDPAGIDRAMRYLFAKHRRQMGDALSCEGGVEIESDWDRSVGDAIRRTRDRRLILAAYSLTALAIFARTAQEGAERRIDGQAAACPAL